MRSDASWMASASADPTTPMANALTLTPFFSGYIDKNSTGSEP